MKMEIPTKYLSDLSKGKEWQKVLASKVLTDHFTNSARQKVLIRSVGNEIRGFLSDRYKRLNSHEIMFNFLQATNNSGLYPLSMFTDDTRNWCEVIDNNIIDIDTPNNGIVSVVFGMRLGNSDFGDGAFELSSFFLQVVCMNGMTRKNALREVHLGKRLADDIEYSQRTYELDTATTISAMKDTFNYLVGPEFREKQIATIQGASAKIIEPESYIKKLQPMGMFKGEIELVKQLLMTNRIEDGLQGECSLWKFSQSVSAVGRKEDNERRNREIQEIASSLLEPVLVN